MTAKFKHKFSFIQNCFLWSFNRYKAQEPLKVKSCWMKCVIEIWKEEVASKDYKDMIDNDRL